MRAMICSQKEGKCSSEYTHYEMNNERNAQSCSKNEFSILLCQSISSIRFVQNNILIQVCKHGKPSSFVCMRVFLLLFRGSNVCDHLESSQWLSRVIPLDACYIRSYTSICVLVVLHSHIPYVCFRRVLLCDVSVTSQLAHGKLSYVPARGVTNACAWTQIHT